MCFLDRKQAPVYSVKAALTRNGQGCGNRNKKFQKGMSMLSNKVLLLPILNVSAAFASLHGQEIQSRPIVASPLPEASGSMLPVSLESLQGSWQSACNVPRDDADGSSADSTEITIDGRSMILTGNVFKGRDCTEHSFAVHFSGELALDEGSSSLSFKIDETAYELYSADELETFKGFVAQCEVPEATVQEWVDRFNAHFPRPDAGSFLLELIQVGNKCKPGMFSDNPPFEASISSLAADSATFTFLGDPDGPTVFTKLP